MRSRLWRARRRAVPELDDAQLLIADGHHRYETALAFHEEDGTEASAWLLAVLVPTAQKGLTIFPTHRIAHADEAAAAARAARRTATTVRSRRSTRATGTGYLVRRARRARRRARRPLRAARCAYTPSADEARAAVDAGEAEAAFLLRPPTVEQVAAVAEAGKTMPQKSTFFYPKLTSGLLFLPLD